MLSKSVASYFIILSKYLWIDLSSISFLHLHFSYFYFASAQWTTDISSDILFRYTLRVFLSHKIGLSCDLLNSDAQSAGIIVIHHLSHSACYIYIWQIWANSWHFQSLVISSLLKPCVYTDSFHSAGRSFPCKKGLFFWNQVLGIWAQRAMKF